MKELKTEPEMVWGILRRPGYYLEDKIHVVPGMS